MTRSRDNATNVAGDISGVTAGTGLSGGGTGGTVTLNLSTPVAATNGGTGLSTFTTGDMIYASGANTPARLGIGSTDQVLKVSGGIPVWAATPAASFVGCLLNKSATQSIAHDAEAIVSYNQETFDTDGFHDNSTNNTRITVPSGKGGYYLFYGNYHFASNSTGVRMAYFIKNGAGGAIQGSQTLLGATASNVFITNNAILINLTAGDYLEMAVQQTSGGSLNLNTTHTVFGCTYLGA